MIYFDWSNLTSCKTPVKHWCEFEFISKTVKNPNIHIRNYSYYSAYWDGGFERCVVRYLWQTFDCRGARLISSILVILSALVLNAWLWWVEISCIRRTGLLLSRSIRVVLLLRAIRSLAMVAGLKSCHDYARRNIGWRCCGGNGCCGD